MMKLARNLLFINPSSEARTLFQRTSEQYLNKCRTINSDSAAYDGDGRTTVKTLDDENSNLNLVDSYSTMGFRITGNLLIKGSIILFPTNVFSWAVKRGKDITPESLFLFDIIVPKIKIVVIGYGSYGEAYDPSLPLILKQKGISCEMLPTRHAVTTYNFLASDAVHVAGAFVPILDEEGPMKSGDAAELLGANVFQKESRHVKHDFRETYDSVLPYYKNLKREDNKKTFDE